MATPLNKPLTRETGLMAGDNPVYVTLIPTKDGGAIVFKEKGTRGSGKTIPLKSLIESPTERTPVVVDSEDPGTADLIDMATLETRIMIQAGEDMTPAIKGKLQSIVREIREERREEFGLPPVYRGTAKRRRDESERD